MHPSGAQDDPLFSRAIRGAELAINLTPAARSIESAVLRALAERSQVEAARSSGISESRLSRWKSSAPDGGGLFLAEVASVLAALGLAVIPADPGDLVPVPADELRALRLLARKALGDGA